MKPLAFKMYHDSLENFGHLTAPQIMALTMWAEARGESREGKIAVGTVILERVDHRSWDGNTVQEVCLYPYQFSCYLKSDPNYSMMISIAKDFTSVMLRDKSLAECHDIANGLIQKVIFRDPELEATSCCQYLTTAAKAGVTWWQTMHFVKKLGHHEFYA